MTSAIDDAFHPPGEDWQRISSRLTTARRIVLALVMLPATVFAAASGLIPDVPAAVPVVAAAVCVAVFAWLWWLIGRRVRSYGYAERADDLLVTSGILFRRLVIVPYGRMQLVDVIAGPIDRALGIATVKLHTAAATTDAAIPGLEPQTAGQLRDRLAARGESRSAGL